MRPTRGETPEKLTYEFNKLLETNALANIHLYNLFMPLILKGKGKKVTVITSGMADLDLVNQYDIDGAALYSISKAAMNMVTAKFNAQYKNDGVLFLSICPGMVDVGHFNNGMNNFDPSLMFTEWRADSRTATPEELAKLGQTVEKFQKYAPHFKGPDTPEISVKAVLSVVRNSSLENGDGGAYLSHFGTKQWL